MDELAYATGTDSLALRLKNYSERDENEDKPYTSKKLRTALQVGAERFGWSRRTPEPRSMRDGRELVGWGMAGGAWKAKMSKISASARLTADGKLVVASATADIGSGTCTILTQIAADALGPPMEAVAAKVGDSSLPTSPVEGGVQGNAGLQEEGTAHGGNLALSVASGALYGALKPNGVTPVEAGLAFGMGFWRWLTAAPDRPCA